MSHVVHVVHDGRDRRPVGLVVLLEFLGGEVGAQLPHESAVVVLARLVGRAPGNPERRHAVRIAVTDQGRALVERVSQRRRAAIAEVLAHVPADRRAAVLDGLAEFTAASGEPDPRDLQTLAL